LGTNKRRGSAAVIEELMEMKRERGRFTRREKKRKTRRLK